MHSWFHDPWFVQKKKKGTFLNWTYIHISLVISHSWGSKSDHVSCIDNIDIWTHALFHSHFAVFSFFQKAWSHQTKDFRPRCERLKTFAAFCVVVWFLFKRTWILEGSWWWVFKVRFLIASFVDTSQERMRHQIGGES